jgi:hypothetical protein
MTVKAGLELGLVVGVFDQAAGQLADLTGRLVRGAARTTSRIA